MIGRDVLPKFNQRFVIRHSEESAHLSVRCDGGTLDPTEPSRIESKDELDQVLEEHTFVLVEFYADWCGPCKLLAPTLETIAQETETVVVKIDIDANREIAFAHRARSVPMMELYKNDERVERLVGMRSEGELRELIRNLRTDD